MDKNLLKCRKCGEEMTPIIFLEKEEEYDPITHTYHETGYARWQCNNLSCEYCGHKELVDDDTFAEEWFEL